MASVKESLAVKYGLLLSPTPEQIICWERRTRSFIEKGLDGEKAADIAARAAFSGYASGPVVLSFVPANDILRAIHMAREGAKALPPASRSNSEIAGEAAARHASRSSGGLAPCPTGRT